MALFAQYPPYPGPVTPPVRRVPASFHVKPQLFLDSCPCNGGRPNTSLHANSFWPGRSDLHDFLGWNKREGVVL